MARASDTKSLAQRIDVGYLRRKHWLRYMRGRLGVALLAVAGLWLATIALGRHPHAVSPGPLATAHRMIDRCETCHTGAAGAVPASAAAWSLHVTDAACRHCHRVPVHQPIEGKTPACASCHVEHQSAAKLGGVASGHCTDCHRDLDDPRVPALAPRRMRELDREGSRKIAQFGVGESAHPEFAVWGDGDRRTALDRAAHPTDPSRIMFSHRLHLAPNLRGPTPDARVTLRCADCHRAPFDAARMPYPRSKAEVRKGEDPQLWLQPPAAAPVEPAPSLAEHRHFAPAEEPAYFLPIRYETHCAGCHPHRVDPRIDAAPHDAPEVVRAFLEGAYARYVLAFPDAKNGTPLRRPIAGERDATSAPTPQDWARHQVARAEHILYRRPCVRRDGDRCLRCVECHFLKDDVDGKPPVVEPPAIRSRWLPQARFDHAAHRNVHCPQCHAGVRESDAATDVLMPRIDTCRACHHVGGADERCAECHTYHGAMLPKDGDGKRTIRAVTASWDDGGT